MTKPIPVWQAMGFFHAVCCVLGHCVRTAVESCRNPVPVLSGRGFSRGGLPLASRIGQCTVGGEWWSVQATKKAIAETAIA